MTDTPAAPTTPERIFADHRQCGSSNGYDGCYSHPVSGDAHCRQDGMDWPCDVELLRQARSTPAEPLDPKVGIGILDNRHDRGGGAVMAETVNWRVPATGKVWDRDRGKTAHALESGKRATVCGRPARRYLYHPAPEDKLCRACCCAIGEHAWMGEDPEHCMDCGAIR